MARFVCLMLGMALVACGAGGVSSRPDTGGGPPIDGGAVDAGLQTDGGPLDGGTPDGGTPDGGPADGGGPPCPGDMVLVSWFCMDRFEAPNLPGALPLAMQTAFDGQDWCAGRGKRLCTEDEWLRACQGSGGWTYPYGETWEAHRCNDDKTWIAPDWEALGTWPAQAARDEAERLYQADPSGSRTGCVSDEGVVDLTGSVAEWVVRTLPHTNNYDHVMKGCYWAKCFGGSNPSCGFVNPAHPGGFRTYEAGFRCCRDSSLPGAIGE